MNDTTTETFANVWTPLPTPQEGQPSRSARADEPDRNTVRERGWTQVEAARRRGVT